MLKSRFGIISFVMGIFTLFLLLESRISILNYDLHYNYMVDIVKNMDKKVEKNDFRKNLIIFPIANNNAVSLPKKPDKTTKKAISTKERILFLRKRKKLFRKYQKAKLHRKIISSKRKKQRKI